MSNFGKIHVLIYKSTDCLFSIYTAGESHSVTVLSDCRSSLSNLPSKDGRMIVTNNNKTSWQEEQPRPGQGRMSRPLLSLLLVLVPSLTILSSSSIADLCLQSIIKQFKRRIKTRNYSFGVRNDFSFQYWEYEYYTAL